MIIAERCAYETIPKEQRVNFAYFFASSGATKVPLRRLRNLCRDTNAAIGPPDRRMLDESGRYTRVPEWE